MAVLNPGPVRLSVPAADVVMDLHGDPAHHDLALFVHGSDWMVMEDLLRAFRAAYPEFGDVYYETLPAGILVRQMREGALQVGDLVIRVPPDVIAAGSATLAELAEEEWLAEYQEYASTTLTILVRQGNPLGIIGWSDLLRPEVRVALPNPEREEIGRLVREAVVRALGEEGWMELCERRRLYGANRLTEIHHRQTPQWVLEGEVDAGPVWVTEALHQAREGAPLEAAELPEGESRRGRFALGIVERTCRHPEAAQAFVEFVRGPSGRAVYEQHGFEAPGAHEPAYESAPAGPLEV